MDINSSVIGLTCPLFIGWIKYVIFSDFRCLCLAGCNTLVKNQDGAKPEITALKFGHNDISNMLLKVKNVSSTLKYFLVLINVSLIVISITKDCGLFTNVYNVFLELWKWFAFQSSTQDTYIRQLLPNTSSLPRVNVQLFGHSGVGKTTLVETLKTGYFGSFFRRSKPLINNNSTCCKFYTWTSFHVNFVRYHCLT